MGLLGILVILVCFNFSPRLEAVLVFFFLRPRILTPKRHVCQTALWSPKKHKNGSWQRPIEWPSGPLMLSRFGVMERQRNQDVGNLQGVSQMPGHIPWVHGVVWVFLSRLGMDWEFLILQKTYCKSPKKQQLHE